MSEIQDPSPPHACFSKYPEPIEVILNIEGAKTIAVARGERERERLGFYLPDYVVSNLSGLLDLKSLRKELKEE